jgi:murein DD-endopeptidase MepM/ murein hydrolase activator NlpD
VTGFRCGGSLLHRAPLVLAMVAASTCGGPTAPGEVDSSCQPGPNTATKVVALFQKPFAGEFRLGNYFDHSLPVPFANDNGFILTTCGTRTEPGIDGHNGYDWQLPHGTPVLAAAEGVVLAAGLDAPFFCPLLGRTVTQVVVVLRHQAGGQSFLSEYGHLDRVLVQRGDVVPAGTVVGYSGNTGCSTGPHLHFDAAVETGDGGYVLIDPYGWHSPLRDPWSQDTRGAESVWLWRPGEAPRLR